MNHDAKFLIRSFLNNRKQIVYINETHSDVLINYNGVPQGSIVAALFFLIFINDIFDEPFKGALELYADIALTY